MWSRGPELSDGVVCLRPLALADAAAHLEGEDAELVRWYNGGHGSLENVEDYIRGCGHQWRAGGPLLTFGISAAGVLVGSIELDLDRQGLRPGQADIAYGLYPRARGHGFATRAVLLGCGFLAGLPEFRGAVIQVDPANAPSVAVAERCGFRWAYRRPAFAGGLDCYHRDLREARGGTFDLREGTADRREAQPTGAGLR